MSNRLLKMVHQVKGVKGPARAVLVVLADEARDYHGGRSSLTTAEIAERTGFSARTVHRAYVDLAKAGHITREPGKPGADVMTLVHPQLEDVSAPANLSAPACQSVRGSYIQEDYNQSNHSQHHEARAREPAAPVLDEVDQVFAAWDAFQQRAGLPAIARGMARRGAVAARIADHGLGSALMVIDRTERAMRERRAPKGQGDLFFRFDMVFGVGSLAEYIVFERMLDGHFTPAEPKTEPAVRAPPPDRSGEGEAEREVRRLVRAEIGDHSYDVWIQPAALKIEGDRLVVTAASGFAADWISQNFTFQLRRAASLAAGRAITFMTCGVGTADRVTA